MNRVYSSRVEELRYTTTCVFGFEPGTCLVQLKHSVTICDWETRVLKNRVCKGDSVSASSADWRLLKLKIYVLSLNTEHAVGNNIPVSEFDMKHTRRHETGI